MSSQTPFTEPLSPQVRSLQAGDVIGEGFVIERTLGGGGMGQVFLARDPRLDRLVAVKLLHATVAQGEEADARFRREARALSRIVHPNVVGIHTFGRANDAWFLVMEYVEGQSLEAQLRAGPLPLREALAIARQVASGLQEAHALGIVHRDVKPGNVLLRALASGGQIAKICDFGLARQFQGQETMVLTQEATILGTPSYMAPEQTQGQVFGGSRHVVSRNSPSMPSSTHRPAVSYGCAVGPPSDGVTIRSRSTHRPSNWLAAANASRRGV